MYLRLRPNVFDDSYKPILHDWFSLLIDLLYTYEPQIETLDRLYCQDEVLSQPFQGNG